MHLFLLKKKIGIFSQYLTLIVVQLYRCVYRVTFSLQIRLKTLPVHKFDTDSHPIFDGPVKFVFEKGAYVKFKANLKGKCDHVSTFICRQIFLYFISITRRVAFEYILKHAIPLFFHIICF